jgi:hypothetical protein
MDYRDHDAARAATKPWPQKNRKSAKRNALRRTTNRTRAAQYMYDHELNKHAKRLTLRGVRLVEALPPNSSIQNLKSEI